MIVRLRDGVCNVPATSLAFVFGIGLYCLYQFWWMGTALDDIAWSLFVIIALFSLHFLRIRWCKLVGGSYRCSTLFRAVIIPRHKAHIAYEEAWWSIPLHVALYVFIGSHARHELRKPLRIILCGSSGQRFYLGITIAVREREQALDDLMAGLRVDVNGIDKEKVRQESSESRSISNLFSVVILLIAIPLLIYLLFTQYVLGW